MFVFFIFFFSLQIHGLQNPSGLHWPGEYGKPNGQEPDQTWLPCDCYRCLPWILQRATGTGCSSENTIKYDCMAFKWWWFLIDLRWHCRFSSVRGLILISGYCLCGVLCKSRFLLGSPASSHLPDKGLYVNCVCPALGWHPTQSKFPSHSLSRIGYGATVTLTRTKCLLKMNE